MTPHTKFVVKPIGTQPALRIHGTFYDAATDTLTLGVVMPPAPPAPPACILATEDAPAPYRADAAKAAKVDDAEPHTILGQGDTARHLST